jgi:hypothetical protein
MQYKAYIESLNGFPIADWGVSAYLGFKQSQMNVIFFEDIEEVPKSKYNIVVACIETTNKYFERFGIPAKQALNIPPELMKYCHRDIDYMTMEEFKRDTRLPIFVKPNGRAKEFVAGVITKEESRKFFFNDVPDNSPVLISECIDIVSEYRGYVYDKKLQGLYWYMGDFRKFVDCSIIDKAIEDYTTQPAGYSIDFGLTSDGRTVLIECNDGWSLGNYGLEAGKYCKLLTRRWIEIFKAY